MEQFITEIEDYCMKHGMRPQRLLREAVDASWATWEKWRRGDGAPTLTTADRIRAHMAEHPVSTVTKGAA